MPPLKAAFASVGSDAEPPINPKTLPVPGFVMKTHAMGDSQKWFLNCCAHEIVDRPLANGSQEPVDDKYLDAWCLSNVQVPLHVCSRRSTVDHAGEASTAIDVVFNPALTKRAASGKNAAVFQEHMCTLALVRAEAEYGLKLDRKYKVIRATYKGGRGDGSLPVPVPELIDLERRQIAAAMAGRAPQQHSLAAAMGSAPAKPKKLVQEFDSWDEAEQAARAKAGPGSPSSEPTTPEPTARSRSGASNSSSGTGSGSGGGTGVATGSSSHHPSASGGPAGAANGTGGSGAHGAGARAGSGSANGVGGTPAPVTANGSGSGLAPGRGLSGGSNASSSGKSNGSSAAGQAIKKGFLANAGGKLYPTGSSEGTPAPGAGDPLGWMPEKLRSRVQTVDTASMSEEEQQRMMRVHAGLEEDPKVREGEREADTETLRLRRLPRATCAPILSSAHPEQPQRG
jgi:hypothetical protein